MIAIGLHPQTCRIDVHRLSSPHATHKRVCVRRLSIQASAREIKSRMLHITEGIPMRCKLHTAQKVTALPMLASICMLANISFIFSKTACILCEAHLLLEALKEEALPLLLLVRCADLVPSYCRPPGLALRQQRLS